MTDPAQATYDPAPAAPAATTPIAGPPPVSQASFQTAQQKNGSQPIPFDVGGEFFYAAAEAPGGALLDAAAANDPGISNVDKVRKVAAFLDAVLLPESAARFAERFRDATNPIDLPVAADIVKWLMTRYGNSEQSEHPTVPSAP